MFWLLVDKLVPRRDGEWQRAACVRESGGGRWTPTGGGHTMRPEDWPCMSWDTDTFQGANYRLTKANKKKITEKNELSDGKSGLGLFSSTP